MMIKSARRKDFRVKDYKLGKKCEGYLDKTFAMSSMKYKWYNRDKESFLDIDFDIWPNNVFSQVLSEAISEDRYWNWIHGKRKISYRVSLIEEQAHKVHPVLYMQPMYDASIAYWEYIETLNEYLKMDKRTLEHDYNIFKELDNPYGKWEWFLRMDLSRAKEMELMTYVNHQSLCKQNTD